MIFMKWGKHCKVYIETKTYRKVKMLFAVVLRSLQDLPLFLEAEALTPAGSQL